MLELDWRSILIEREFYPNVEDEKRAELEFCPLVI
jgi:hypothetical protein